MKDLDTLMYKGEVFCSHTHRTPLSSRLYIPHSQTRISLSAFCNIPGAYNRCISGHTPYSARTIPCSSPACFTFYILHSLCQPRLGDGAARRECDGRVPGQGARGGADQQGSRLHVWHQQQGTVRQGLRRRGNQRKWVVMETKRM